jgi:multidrug transporter EmrE-like cation transporter
MTNPEILGGKTPNEKFWLVLGLVFVIALFEACGQYTLKTGHDKGESRYLVIGIFFYSFVCFMLFRSYKYEGLAHVNLIWSCLSIIMAYISGVLFFKEVCNKYTILAIFLALCAIYVSHLSDEVGNE